MNEAIKDYWTVVPLMVIELLQVDILTSFRSVSLVFDFPLPTCHNRP